MSACIIFRFGLLPNRFSKNLTREGSFSTAVILAPVCKRGSVKTPFPGPI